MTTAIAAALDRAGVNTDQSALFVEAASCLTSGKDFASALHAFQRRVRANDALFRELCREYLQDRADDIRGERMEGGAIPSSPRGQTRSAAAPQQNGAESQSRYVQKDQQSLASATPRNEAGQEASADKAGSLAPRLVSTSPGTTRRGLGSIAAVQPVIAKSIFAATTLPDGRSLDKVQWHELPKLASEYRQHSRMLMLLYRRVIPTDAFMTVDQVVHEQDVVEAIKQAEQFNDVL